MISPDTLDALLTLWARAKLNDNLALRRLWYPSATPEEKYARRGGAAPAANHDPGDPEAFERVDRAMAMLREHRRTLYAAIHQRWLTIGPDESRAKRLGVPVETFKSRLDAANRWLREELDE